jgi:DNA-binding MarR family transcriptional regulator
MGNLAGLGGEGLTAAYLKDSIFHVSRLTKRDLFLETMTAFREYTSAVDLVNQIVAERMGINRTDHRVLEVLNRQGPTTAGDLAEASHLTTGAITAVLDRLERTGLARRVRDTEDRRRVLVEQTPESAQTGMRYYGPLMNRSFDAMAHFTSEELAAIRDFMGRAASLTAQYAKELGSADDQPTAAETI